MINMTVDNFSVRCKTAREASGLSQTDVAEAIGISPQAVYNYENRPNSTPAIDKLFPLADKLGVSARWLLLGEDDGLASPKENRIAKHLAALPEDRLDALAVILGIRL